MWMIKDIQNLFTVNDLDRKIRIYLIGETQDLTYTTDDSSNDPGGNHVPGLDQRVDAELQIHFSALLVPWL